MEGAVRPCVMVLCLVSANAAVGAVAAREHVGFGSREAPPVSPPIPYPHPLITEVLYAVPKDAGDANHDGARDAAGDEFVELINPHDRPINLKGYALRDSGEGKSQFKFTFPAFELGPGEIVVVFNGFEATMAEPVGTGKAAPREPNRGFHGAWVFTAGMSSGKASLANASDYVALVGPNGAVVACVWWGKDRTPPRAILLEEAPAVMRGSVQRALTGPEDMPENEPAEDDPRTIDEPPARSRDDRDKVGNPPAQTLDKAREKNADTTESSGSDESEPDDPADHEASPDRGTPPTVEEHDESVIDTESDDPPSTGDDGTDEPAPTGDDASKAEPSRPGAASKPQPDGDGTSKRTAPARDDAAPQGRTRGKPSSAPPPPAGRDSTSPSARPPTTRSRAKDVEKRPKVYREFIAHPVMPQHLAGRVPDAQDEGTGVRFSPGVFFLTPIGESSAPPADSNDGRKSESGDAGATKSPKDTTKPAGDSHRNRGEPR